MLRKKKSFTMLSMVLTMILALFIPSLNPAFAATNDTPNPAPKFTKTEVQQMVKESEAIFPYVKKDNGVFVVDSEKARQNGVSEKLIKDTENGFAELNQKLNQNKLRTLGSCGGVSKTVSTSSGRTVYLNSCEANELSYALAIKSGVTAAVAAVISPIVPAGIAGAIVAATLGVASATVGYYNSYGDGVKIYYKEYWVVWQFQYTYDYMRSQ
ncbi:hypothetical protein [Bacillus cereus]|uniref:hypothetical protein n=1 Tax=Bacillus cereus TaxID=1396 RepID=UPI00382F8D44